MARASKAGAAHESSRVTRRRLRPAGQAQRQGPSFSVGPCLCRAIREKPSTRKTGFKSPLPERRLACSASIRIASSPANSPAGLSARADFRTGSGSRASADARPARDRSRRDRPAPRAARHRVRLDRQAIVIEVQASHAPPARDRVLPHSVCTVLTCRAISFGMPPSTEATVPDIISSCRTCAHGRSRGQGLHAIAFVTDGHPRLPEPSLLPHPR